MSSAKISTDESPKVGAARANQLQEIRTVSPRSWTISTDSSSPPRSRRALVGALAGYVVLASILAICQKGYINADFVGYSEIARRVLAHPSASVTGYWSPLYSWCQAPLLAVGLNDLVAGRLVLLLSGGGYVAAIFGIVSRFKHLGKPPSPLLTTAVLTCAVLQASVWATYLLDPDLLADGLLFVYFFTLTDPALPQKPTRAFLGGLAAGAAYLAKAYMLPFVLVQLPVALLLRHVMTRPGVAGQAIAGARFAVGTNSFRPWLVVWCVYLVGLTLLAGPWIAVLSNHYGRLTFSTAGSSNHANVSPTNYDHDPLWKPPLVADYISDPGLSPDWSPFENRANFLHQVRLILANGKNCAIGVAGWILLVVLGGVRWTRRQRQQKGPLLGEYDRFAVAWCLASAAIYCGGYCLVSLEARYIAPVVAPLLCVAGMLLREAAAPSESIRTRQFGPLKLAATAFPLMLLIVPQDALRVFRVAVNHPQCASVDWYTPIVRELRAAGVTKRMMAGNRWHSGLSVAYLCGNVAGYLGTPQSTDTRRMQHELNASSASIYLRWTDRSDTASAGSEPMAAQPALETFVPQLPWKFVKSIACATAQTREVAVYSRPEWP